MGTSHDTGTDLSRVPFSSNSVRDKVHEGHGEGPFAAGLSVNVADLKRVKLPGVTKTPNGGDAEGRCSIWRGETQLVQKNLF